jgi:hypothetical protein
MAGKQRTAKPQPKKRGGNGNIVWTSERKAEAADTILAQIAMGKGLVRICQAPDLPKAFTFREWMRSDADLAARYARAREDQADYLADQIVEIADDAEDANKARVQIEARKWVAAKLKSQSYGDKLNLSPDLDAFAKLWQMVGSGEK